MTKTTLPIIAIIILVALTLFLWPTQEDEGEQNSAPSAAPSQELPVVSTETPPEPAVQSLVDLRIDAGSPQGVYHDILDEINTWKMYATFGPPQFAFKKPGWFRALLPWIDYVRTPAALGGNYGPSMSESCDAKRTDDAHLAHNPWECGEAGLAQSYEIVQVDESGAVSYDYSFFEECLGRLLQSGVRPHLNISSANEAFTDGGHYRFYHWNENPVVDFEGWLAFIRETFTRLSRGGRVDLSQWRFSCVNEPNCEIRDKNYVVAKVGYRGDENHYATQFTRTIQAAMEAAPGVRFQMGNYVIRPDFMPPVRTLDVYLSALSREMSARGLSFDLLRYRSLSMFEVPYQSIYGSTSTRFQKYIDWITRANIPILPIKIDEFEIHGDIMNPYNAAHQEELDTTFYAASWMAKTVKAFQENGVVSASGWWTRLGRAEYREWLPFPKYYACAFFPLLSGRIRKFERLGDRGSGRFLRLKDDDREPFHRLPVEGELRAQYRGEDQLYRSVEALATRNEDATSIRLLVFHHQSVVCSDEEIAEQPHPLEVSLTLESMPPGDYDVSMYAITSQESMGTRIYWDASTGATTPFLKEELGLYRVETKGSLRLRTPQGSTIRLPQCSVLFFEIERRP